MPANYQRPAAQIPVSPRNTAKYTNKDGSKFIQVPKGPNSESSQPSTPTASNHAEPPSEFTALETSAPAVNRKKQKRREKAAAKAAAEQGVNGTSLRPPPARVNSRPGPADYEEVDSDGDKAHEVVSQPETTNGHQESMSSKKKKNKKPFPTGDAEHTPLPEASSSNAHAHTSLANHRRPAMSSEKIWSTNSHEERERIKEFWLGLGENERKSLVKVEKDAVLKKMKEQQKHTCSCTVCGRKRTAIEEELEGLYDAYYVELEQFANHGEGPPLLAPPRDFPSHPYRDNHSPYPPQPPSRGRIMDHGDEDEEEEMDDEDEVYSEDGVDDEYSDDEPPEEYHSPHDRDMADFLTFGNSLQVKGGILTVADDLLKNDGKRFIEMMEQLAERRMAREEDAKEHLNGYSHQNGSYSNSHAHPSPEEEEYEMEDDEDFDDSQEEYDDEEDQTEERRMEEGRRMFQIFAARMFEQRVLSAYKEKVAKDRQARLIDELDEEKQREENQKIKKAKAAQKKKEKAAQKKQAQAEEKARKEAEKAAEEADRLAAEQRKVTEQRQRAEEKKRQKEAQKKAEEEARLKKEAEKQRRINEQRAKQEEAERKAKEAKEREKKLKEEQRIKEKEAREQKEREALERKEKQERDKREKEARAARAHKEAQEAKEARDRAKEEKARDEMAAKAAAQASQPAQQPHPSPTITKRAQPPTVLPYHPPSSASFASPKIPVATPVMSKAPTPMRPRTFSHQQDTVHGHPSSTTSNSGSGPSQNPSPHPDSTAHSSPRLIGQHRNENGSMSGTFGSFPFGTQSSSPRSALSSRPSLSTPVQGPPLAMALPPGLTQQHAPPGFQSRMGHESMLPPVFRTPGMMIPPPGINSSIGRMFSPAPMPPGFAHGPVDPFTPGQGFQRHTETQPPLPTHTRQGSAGFDGVPGTPSQPIGRPAPIGAPIGRPINKPQGRTQVENDDDTEQHLGSRALLDDDEPLIPDVNSGSLRTQPPGPRPVPALFGSIPSMEFGSGFGVSNNPWGPPATGGHPFGPPGLSTWPSVPPAFGIGSSAPMAPARPSPSSGQAIRAMLVHGYRELLNAGNTDTEGYLDLQLFRHYVDTQYRELNLQDQGMLELFETEGSHNNGGGNFEVRNIRGKRTVRWSDDDLGSRAGQIGSPIAGPAGLRAN